MRANHLSLPVRRIAGAASAALLCMALGPLLHAQDAGKSDDAYLWTFQYKKGDLITIKTETEITGKSGDHNVILTISQTSRREIKTVTSAGDAAVTDTTLEYTTSLDDGTLNEDKTRHIMTQKDDPASRQAILQTLSKRGLVVKQGSRPDPAADPKIVALGIMLRETPAPIKAVKIGDRWTTELENRMIPGRKVTVTSTLASAEKIAGVDTLKVKLQMTIPSTAEGDAKDAISVEGVYNVDPQAGRLVHAEYRLANVPVHNQTGVSRMKVSYKTDYLLPDDADNGKTRDKPVADH